MLCPADMGCTHVMEQWQQGCQVAGAGSCCPLRHRGGVLCQEAPKVPVTAATVGKCAAFFFFNLSLGLLGPGRGMIRDGAGWRANQGVEAGQGGQAGAGAGADPPPMDPSSSPCPPLTYLAQSRVQLPAACIAACSTWAGSMLQQWAQGQL